MLHGRCPKIIVFALAGVGAAFVGGLAVHLMMIRPGPRTALSDQSPLPKAKPRVLFVDSYHEGYPRSDDITQGVLKVFRVGRTADGGLDDRASKVQLQIIRMDTRRNPSEESKAEAGRKVKAVVDFWKPDVVLCADDGAAAHVIVPFFRNTGPPVVFCGIPWDASGYGLPCRNVTGMVEVSLIPDLLKTMRAQARGERIGLLGARNETNLQEARTYAKRFHLDFAQTVFVDDFRQWKAAYLDLQEKVDMLVLLPPSFLADDPAARTEQAEARRLVLERTRIPTGSVEGWIAPYSLVCFAKKASEQGEWAARTALGILAGKPPATIPVAANRAATVYLNMPLARKMGVRFPVELIERATLMIEEEHGH